LSVTQFKVWQALNYLNKIVADLSGLDVGRCLALIDYVAEDGKMKLGEDLNAVTHRNQILPLEQLSGIVSGVQSSFFRHLQRCRVFVNPDVLKVVSKDVIIPRVQQYLESI
jgi:hypothetical protein